MKEGKNFWMLVHPQLYLILRSLAAFMTGFVLGILFCCIKGEILTEAIPAAVEAGAFVFLTAGILPGMLRLLQKSPS